MLMQRVNRTDPEKAFVIVQNDEASAAMVAGQPYVYTFDGTDDGLDVVEVNTGAAAKMGLVVGLAHDTPAAGEYGLIQVYGPRTDAKIYRSDTAYAVGDILWVMTASDCLSRAVAGSDVGGISKASNATAAAQENVPPMFVAGATKASATTDTAHTDTTTVFIRCL